MNEALELNRIPVATSSREDGRITTDYVQGQAQMNAYGLLGVLNTRYKYSIRISGSGADRTNLAIVSVVESSSNAMPAWRDISADNQARVTALENSLYEHVEKVLTR